MKRLLLPLLAALALPTTVNAEISDKIHNRCKDVKDYMGCVQMMKQESIESKLIESVNDDGVTTLFHPDTVIAKKQNGEWGRYISWRQFFPQYGAQYLFDADCTEYTMDIAGDKRGWVKLKKDKDYKGYIETLDEFCPQMNRLVEEAKSGTKKYYRYPTATGGNVPGGGGSSSSGGYKYNTTQQQLNDFKNRYEMDKLDRQRNELNKKIYDSNQKYRYQSPY